MNNILNLFNGMYTYYQQTTYKINVILLWGFRSGVALGGPRGHALPSCISKQLYTAKNNIFENYVLSSP